MTFWDKNKERIEEDVAADRIRPVAEPIHATKRLVNAKAIEVNQIEADPQHREHFDEDALQRLAKSMKSAGQLQPIRVRFDTGRGKYVIIAGERRWRAAQIAALKTVDCIVAKGDISDADILREQVIENAMREDLQPIEQGKAFAALMEKEGLSGKQLANKLNVHPSTVSRMVGLLSLSEDVQAKVDTGELAITQALKTKSGKPSDKPTKKRLLKEKKISTSVGITITLKARKLLKDEQVEVALREVLEQLQKAA